MPTYIASYDLKETSPDPHSKFLEQAVAHNWKLWILATNGIWYRLPNTTLQGTFADMTAAERALENTRAATQAAMGRTVTMNKWIVVEYSDSRFDSDMRQNA
jgi:hypothetical protein